MTEKEILDELMSDGVGDEALAFLRLHFKQVKSDDSKGRIWTSIHAKGSDEKYGRLMVCPDTREYRSTDFTEFYAGPGVYDYSVPGGAWCRHRNHPKLQPFIIPRPGEKPDFKQYPITLGIVD